LKGQANAAIFLIEVPHPEETLACARIVKVFLSTGSHFLSHADWGCMDGVHSARLTVDADNKEEAWMAAPPQFRSQTKIVGLNKFKLEQIEAVLGQSKP
jgi:hypothetical protein